MLLPASGGVTCRTASRSVASVVHISYAGSPAAGAVAAEASAVDAVVGVAAPASADADGVSDSKSSGAIALRISCSDGASVDGSLNALSG